MWERVLVWSENCFRWLEPRRRVSSSSMKLMPLEAQDLMTDMDPTMMFRGPCLRSSTNLMVSSREVTSKYWWPRIDLIHWIQHSCDQVDWIVRLNSVFLIWRVVRTSSRFMREPWAWKRTSGMSCWGGIQFKYNPINQIMPQHDRSRFEECLYWSGDVCHQSQKEGHQRKGSTRSHRESHQRLQ